MSKQDILNYVKGYYNSFRETKNGYFIYSDIKLKDYKYYTYISKSENNKEFIKDILDIYIYDVKRLSI